ncbi:1-deoxy-D-xylulose-5-phosphate synthase [Carboxydocella sp. JDF658]|uniref:1-deoxy-D-xylulose-5-phosphate synthase n=1 Tax=Carboxydocella sp. JDF658 TaxID=1926600 RepID=UPI0009AE7E5D|nr:1-deoxy-D-xylulose-5-phosphate synthase [Carboxydocella sp. JDF658]GAW30819.1 1-deoxy-D-xylulose-5-phosphate synthase [Carboxydocella sp. JDF658]
MTTSILSQINGPEDLQGLTLNQLKQLAEEIRRELIEVTSRTGGHLAPNLGVVELTIALHRVFNSPADKIIWDVGHQAYVHKLLTGRRDRFATLRQLGGISGFPKREESPHDIFATGHSSTSISAALGIALARDMKKEDFKVVAVIGDGALTGGMAFEALNHAGHTKTDLIVILNDNEMSIAENVGALSSYLTRMRTDPKYYKGKEEIEYILKRIPNIGPKMLLLANRLKDSVKHLVVPGMLFEELGFTYLGPIPGHDLAALKKVLHDAKALTGPVLVHVITKKGKGYLPAEENPDKFHGTGPFDIATGQSAGGTGPISYTEAFGRELVALGQQDARIVAITAAMPTGTGLYHFAREIPHRFFDVGIAEQHAVTLAAGMATQGLKPVVAIYSTFLQRAYDQVLHDVCLQKLPVVLAMDRAGLVGEDGPTHHGVFDIAYLRSIPNLVLMEPKDENELRHMLYTAIQHDGPIALRYPRGNGIGVPLEQQLRQLPLGKAEVLREGSQGWILALGSLVYDALAAAEELAGEGLDIGVVNMRFVKPLDEDLLHRLVATNTPWLTVENHVLAGGFGSAILEFLHQNGYQRQEVTMLGLPDQFIEHGRVEELKAIYCLNQDGIKASCLEMLAKRQQKTILVAGK